MKTLSNAELQDAIMWAVKLIKGDNSKQDTILLVHLENLTDEQKKRATDELTLEPMTTTLERAKFDARVEAQDVNEAWDPCNPACSPEFGGYIDDNCRCKNRFPVEDGPEWVDHDLSDDMPVSRNTTVEVQFGDGQRHGGCAKDFIWTDIDDETNIARYRVWSSSEEKE